MILFGRPLQHQPHILNPKRLEISEIYQHRQSKGIKEKDYHIKFNGNPERQRALLDQKLSAHPMLQHRISHGA
jgi:hypothetical protein